MQGIPLFFRYFIHSVRYNLGKPSISSFKEVTHSRSNSFKEHWKVFVNVTIKIGDTKIKQEIAVNPLSRIIFDFRKS